MKVKTGVDIIEISRIQEAIEKNGEMFLNKVFSKLEIEFCENTNKMKYQHYAARFAAKEAVIKAISELVVYNKEDVWKNIVVKNKESGKPFIEFSGQLSYLNVNKENNIESMDLSISHIKDYAIANFVMLINE